MESIVIDREYGSGGREVAKILSRKVGMEFYDGNMLELAGKKYGIDLSMMKDYDERGTGSFLHDIALFSDAFYGEDRHNRPLRVYSALSGLIQSLAAEKPCIFLGRCADKILKEHTTFLHTFIYASDPDDKINRAVSADGIPRGDAAAYIRKKDTQRRNFRKMMEASKWDSMYSYDLCINTSFIGYEGAADAIIAAMEKRR